MTLTPSQRQAVERTGQDVCIVAGPGSGKTRVLVERFVWLVRRQGVSPLRILAITFTEKAAAEIKTRLAIEFSGDPELRPQVERAYVSTVHGFCSRLLREHSLAARLDPDFGVMEEWQSSLELEQAALDALDQFSLERRDKLGRLLDSVYVPARRNSRQPDLAAALGQLHEAVRTAGFGFARLREAAREGAGGPILDELAKELKALLDSAPSKLTPKQAERIGQWREWADTVSRAADAPPSIAQLELLYDNPRTLPGNILPSLKDWRDGRIPEAASALIGSMNAPLKEFLSDALEKVALLYLERKRKLSMLDYADLEEETIALLAGDSTVRGEAQSRFDQILMDELQDTNPLQWTLVDLLRTPSRFFAVGDINQSIYGFRHAEPGVFRRYRDGVLASGGAVDVLDENFRTRSEILSVINWLTAGLGGVEFRPLNARRSFPAKNQPSVEVIAGLDGGAQDPQEIEAAWIARRIGELAGALLVSDGSGGQRPAGLSDMVLLVRKMSAAAPVQRALRAAGIPFLVEGGRTFSETREVRDLMDLLEALVDPGDEIALAGVLRSPLAGIGDEMLLRMKAAGDLAGGLLHPDGWDSSACEEGDRQRLRRFGSLFAELRSLQDEIAPDRLLARAMDACDYEGGLDEGGRANVNKLLALLRAWSDGSPKPLRTLTGQLEWLRSSAAEAEAPPADSSNVVRILSIHRAKGLQFPIVFLPALHQGVRGGPPPISWSAEDGLGVEWRDPKTGKGLPDLNRRRWEQRATEREKGEEDRLFYVAMTRAEEHLAFSFARTPRPHGRYWELLAGKLGITLDAEDEQPVVQCCGPERTPVRVFRTRRLPETFAAPPVAAPAAAPVELLARPEIKDQYDSAVPVTSVQEFANCPRLYLLGRYLGLDRSRGAPALLGEEEVLEKGGADSLDAAEFGSVVHALLAGEPVEAAPTEALEMASRFRASALGVRAARAERVEREFDFVMALEDMVLRGKIDLWFEEGGELILLDYKTSHVSGTEASRYAASYAVQLRLYAMALERHAGRLPDKACLYLLRSGMTLPVEAGRGSMIETGAVVRAFREAQSRLHFEPQPGDRCRWCGFRGPLCPAGHF